MPYDCLESANIQAFKRLPPCCQHFIRTIQSRIEAEIQEKNPGKFRATSGFRAESVNRKYNGALESLHRLGMSRDFVPIAGFSVYSNPPVVDVERFRVLRSPALVTSPNGKHAVSVQKCWHVEVII
jgi:hypothetical protein